MPSVSGTITFFLLQILGGHIGIPIILITLILNKGVRRHPLVVNFLVTWIVYASSFCLLLYSGNQLKPDPPKLLCSIQASLIYGSTILTTLAGVACIVNLCSCMQAIPFGKWKLSTERDSRRSLCVDLLLTVPYLAFLICTVVMLSALHFNEHLVIKAAGSFYCSVDSNTTRLIPTISGAAVAVALALECVVALRMWRMYKAYGRMEIPDGFRLPNLVRVMLVSLFSLLALIMCGIFWDCPTSIVPYIFQATLPTAAFIIFGTQSDLLEVWGFTRMHVALRRLAMVRRDTDVIKSDSSPV